MLGFLPTRRIRIKFQLLIYNIIAQYQHIISLWVSLCILLQFKHTLQVLTHFHFSLSWWMHVILPVRRPFVLCRSGSVSRRGSSLSVLLRLLSVSVILLLMYFTLVASQPTHKTLAHTRTIFHSRRSTLAQLRWSLSWSRSGSSGGSSISPMCTVMKRPGPNSKRRAPWTCLSSGSGPLGSAGWAFCGTKACRTSAAAGQVSSGGTSLGRRPLPAHSLVWMGWSRVWWRPRMKSGSCRFLLGRNCSKGAVSACSQERPWSRLT